MRAEHFIIKRILPVILNNKLVRNCGTIGFTQYQSVIKKGLQEFRNGNLIIHYRK